MATDLAEINAEKPDDAALDRAADEIRRGHVVAVPTDALYSMVADPFNLNAVGRVFAAKGREQFRSLPLLIPDLMAVEELGKEIPQRFYVLARHFWPGPLTVIVPASVRVPLKVTGNTGRLALRQPRSVVAQALLERIGHPLIGTSANISGQPTCRSGIEAFGVMDGRVSLVLDGGVTPGCGATTIDITEPIWRLIREGDVPVKDIADCLG